VNATSRHPASGKNAPTAVSDREARRGRNSRISEVSEQRVKAGFHVGQRDFDVLLAGDRGVRFLADDVLDRELALVGRGQRLAERADRRDRIAMRQCLEFL
jgi:hypothetical protein